LPGSARCRIGIGGYSLRLRKRKMEGLVGIEVRNRSNGQYGVNA
jgi:hypothetical protein